MSDPLASTDPDSRNAPRTQRWAHERFANSSPGHFTWLLISLTILVALAWIVPSLLERVQYSMTRGKMRAEREAATDSLQSPHLDALSRAFQDVSKRVAPSVVNIHVVSAIELDPRDDLSALFGPRRRERQGQGSGLIVDASGFILTNNHVVHGATEIQVALADGHVLRATEVGVDPLTDLALLKVNAANLDPVEWGDSSAVEVGALVWAVGSPFGLQHSITAGIISGKNRPGAAASVYYDFIQTDAAVNPGNSGGPLVDTHGRVIGINTAILGESFQGISFAIPSNEARAVYERLRADGRVARGWLGVSLSDVDAERAKQLGFDGGLAVHIELVTTDSPAEKAGLRKGDLIIRWDGNEVRNATSLRRLVARAKIGAPTEVVIWRLGQQQTVSVTVGERPSGPSG